jgi:hypothetical protein
MTILFAIADMIHESILDASNAISTFITRSSPANRAQNGANPGSQTAGNEYVVEKEQSRLRGNSMEGITGQRLSESGMICNLEKIGLDRS